MAKLECSMASWMSIVYSTFLMNISGCNKEYVEQKMYLSTHTSEGEQNYIMQVSVQLPLPDSVIDMRRYDNDGNCTHLWIM